MIPFTTQLTEANLKKLRVGAAKNGLKLYEHLNNIIKSSGTIEHCKCQSPNAAEQSICKNCNKSIR